jgi:hypothetical protein
VPEPIDTREFDLPTLDPVHKISQLEGRFGRHPRSLDQAHESSCMGHLVERTLRVEEAGRTGIMLEARPDNGLPECHRR